MAETEQTQVTQQEQTKKLSQQEFEKKVLDLAKQGYTSEKIGETLRQQEIHPAEYEKKIGKILKENNAFEDPDLKNIQNKFERVQEHSRRNKQDKRAIRERTRLFAKVRKLKKYRGIPIKKEKKKK